jgi:spermidine synthase
MPSLPPLDHEYHYIAKEVLHKEEATVDGELVGIRTGGVANAHGGLRMALVGLGGGMIAQYLIAHSAQLSIDAIELNGNVIAAARAFFGVANAETNGRLHVVQGDGRARLNDAPPSTYGIVVVDCFGDGRVPASCRSEAFVEAAYRAMEPGAVMLQNILVDRPDNPGLDKEVRNDLEELLDAYRKVFGRQEVELQSKWTHGNGVVRAQKRR